MFLTLALNYKFYQKKRLAFEYGLEFVESDRFQDVLNKYKDAPGHKIPPINITQDEWQASCLYMTFVFRKVTPSIPRIPNNIKHIITAK